MKKILFIAALLIGFLGNAQFIINAGATAGASGASTTAYDLAATSAAITSAGVGAEIEIRADIVLTANFTPPANQHWVFTTGSIDLAGFTLTGNNTSWESTRIDKVVFDAFTGTIAGTWLPPSHIYSTQFALSPDGKKYYRTGSITTGTTTLTVTDGTFTADDVGEFIAVREAATGFALATGSIDFADPFGNSALQTTIASVTSPTVVELTAAATRTASSVDVWTGSDNFNGGKNFIYMRNQASGTIVFDPGIYFKSRIDEPIVENPETDPASWTFGFGTDDITLIGHGATIHQIPHAEYGSMAINLFNTHRFKWYGGVLHGELYMHNYSAALSPFADEGGHGLVLHSTVNNVHIEGVDFVGFLGDNIFGKGSLQSLNYIKGTAASGYPGEAILEQGTLNETTGATEASSVFYRTDTYLDVTSLQFENTRQMHPTRAGKRLYQLSGSSLSGWGGLKNPRYRAFYYDSSNNFLGVTGNQEYYDIYELPESVAKVKIVVEDLYDPTVVDLQFRAPVTPENLTMVNVNSYDSGRHGAANLPNNTTWRDSEIVNVGNTLPAYGINVEDYRRAARNYHFDNLTFKGNYAGGISLVGAVNTTISNCKFEATTEPGKQYHPSFVNALKIDFGRNVVVTGNIINQGHVILGRSDQFHDNTMIGGYIQSEANGVTIKDNTLHNTYIKYPNALDVQTDREQNWIEGNKFTFDDEFPFLIFDRNLASILKDTEVRFNHKARLSFSVEADSTYNEIVLGANTINKLYSVTGSIERDFGGYIENLRLVGARGDISTRDYTSQTIMSQDIDGLYAEMELSLGSGGIKDITLNDIEVDGYFWLAMNNYSGTLSSPTTVTMTDFFIHVEDTDYNWVNSGSNVFKTEAKNFNLVAKDGIIELNESATPIGSANFFIDLNHLGTTTFQDVIFRSTVNTSIPFDLTNTNIFPANLGAVTFIDCDFEGVNITLRSGDKQLFTRPSADLESYADDAAATTGGIPATGEYLYWNTTNNALDVNG